MSPKLKFKFLKRMFSILAQLRGVISRRTPLHVGLCLLVFALSLGLSFGLANIFLVQNIQSRVELAARGPPDIRLGMQLLNIDATAGTFVVDWYPHLKNSSVCPEPPFFADIIFDPNLLISESTKLDKQSNNEPATSSFTFNSTAACRANLRTASPTFRTVSKLSGDVRQKFRSSLQHYPFDVYISQIAIFAQDQFTNRTIQIDIDKTWGIVPNFQVQLAFTEEEDGVIYAVFDVSRSKAVRIFVVLTVIANWSVTTVFLWITIACILWPEKIVRDLFVLPLGALFAFTSVRSNLPGAPSGFGAYIDFIGILPNLVLITLCTFVLLFAVLIRRILGHDGLYLDANDLEGIATEAHIIRRKLTRFAMAQPSQHARKAKKLRRRVDRLERRIHGLAKSVEHLHRKEGTTAKSAGDIITLGKEIVPVCRQFVQNCLQQPVVEPDLVASLESLEGAVDELIALNPAHSV